MTESKSAIASPVSGILIAVKTERPPLNQHGLFLAATCILVAGSVARPAAADQYDALNVVLGSFVTHDSNLFRIPDSVNPQTVLGQPTKSDTISAVYAGLRIDKPYAQQRFQLDVNGTTYRYDNFSFLNFDALDYRGAWLWHLSPRLSGTLSADHREYQVPFEDFRGFQRNVRITDNRVFNLDGWAFGGWHVLLGASQYDQKSEQSLQPEADYRAVNAEAGVKYLARSGSWIAVIKRATDGEYRNRVINLVTFDDNGFRQDDSEVKATWNLNGKSVVIGRLTWLERRHDHFAQRDFSGTAGEFRFAWTPTSKLSLEFLAKRDILPWQDLFSSYRVNETLSFAPTWQASAKTAVRMRFDRVHSDFRGPVVVSNVPSRSDTTGIAQLGVDWSPMRSVSLSANLLHQLRSSNNPLVEYDTTILNFSAALMF